MQNDIKSLDRQPERDRVMVANYRRAAERTRDQAEVDELLVSIFGWRLTPDYVVERMAARRASS